jgi:putative transposase
VTRAKQVWVTDITPDQVRGRPSIPMARGFVYLIASMSFTSVLHREKIAISMDARGAWRDNVFVERLWRSVKNEEVYLRAYGSVSEARASIGRYLTFYNGRRPHSSLDRKTPDHVSFNQPLLAAT